MFLSEGRGNSPMHSLFPFDGSEGGMIRVDGDRVRRAEMERLSGRHTVPQIWINQQHVGGCDELFALEANGELDSLIKGHDHE